MRSDGFVLSFGFIPSLTTCCNAVDTKWLFDHIMEDDEATTEAIFVAKWGAIVNRPLWMSFQSAELFHTWTTDETKRAFALIFPGVLLSTVEQTIDDLFSEGAVAFAFWVCTCVVFVALQRRPGFRRCQPVVPVAGAATTLAAARTMNVFTAPCRAKIFWTCGTHQKGSPNLPDGFPKMRNEFMM